MIRKWTIEDWTRAIASNNRDKGWRDERLPTETRALAQFIGAQLMLITTEVAEACEAVREGELAPSCDPFSAKPVGLPSELADIIIRTLDLADMLGIDLSAALEEKHSYNIGRAHRHGNKLL
jgi:NTP pyrophosphatase (non-canonical NTP hydrolase)